MRDFTEKDWKEVCENIQRIKKEYLATLPPEELRPYYYLEEREHINELGMSLKDYEKIVDGHCGVIHEHIYKICCIGDLCIDSVKHWRHEIRTHLRKLHNAVLKGTMRKDKVLMNNFIKIMLDPKTFEPDGDGMFRSAMNDEINNAKRHPDDIRLKKDAEIIKRDILPNITQLRLKYKKDIGVLMKAIYNGLVANDWGMIEAALDKYIMDCVPGIEDRIDLIIL